MPANQYSAPPAMMLEDGKTYTVSVETNYGTMEFSFYPEDAPQTVNDSPFGDGWLMRIRPAEASQIDALLDAAAYSSGPGAA
jgi:hypothetical protein